MKSSNERRRIAAAEQVLAAQTMYHDAAPSPTATHSSNECSPDVHQPYPLDAIGDAEPSGLSQRRAPVGWRDGIIDMAQRYQELGQAADEAGDTDRANFCHNIYTELCWLIVAVDSRNDDPARHAGRSDDVDATAW